MMKTDKLKEINEVLFGGFFTVTANFDMANYSDLEIGNFLHLENTIAFAQMMKEKFLNDIPDNGALDEEDSFHADDKPFYFYGVSKNGENFVTVEATKTIFKDLTVNCLNCGYQQEAHIEKIRKDHLGYYMLCEKCDSSFNV